MIQLTPSIAEKLAREIFSKMKDKEAGEFYILHSNSVAEIALILAYKKKVDKDILIIAGWLHDLGASISRENHARLSLDILEREEYEVNDKLRDCILEHGTNGLPKTEEGKIIKVADKVSFLNPELISQAIKYSENGKIKQDYLDFLKKASSQAIELLGGLEMDKLDNYHAILLDTEFKDPSFIDKWKIIGKKKSRENNWWQLKVDVPENRLEELIKEGQKLLISNKYYFQIYRDNELIIVFPDKIFYITPKKETWGELLEYGRACGIPEDQLDMKPVKFEEETY